MAALVFALVGMLEARANLDGIRIGTLPPGPTDGIGDVAGVRVGHVTKIEGSGPLRPGIGPIRTGVTAILPNDDPWSTRVAAAFESLNGNGEMTGSHWVNEAGFLETPIVLTDTLAVPRASDGVITWLVKKHPDIGISDDVPLPVVAECDDGFLNDIQGRHIDSADVARALDGASPVFARGNVGAGTGMLAFGLKGGIGSASRRTSAQPDAYTVGVLVNANVGSQPRRDLRIDGAPIGRAMEGDYRPIIPHEGATAPTRGHAGDGSIIVIVATDAPLESRQLHALAKRAMLGLGRTGATSRTSSGDLFLAFSTTVTYPRDEPKTRQFTILRDDAALDELYEAAAEATEAAVADALLSARTMTGIDGRTFFALPAARVRSLLETMRSVPQEPPGPSPAR
ncbi:MAG: P1 family peptidase [Vulcanimicrobiaceae bacterium]